MNRFLVTGVADFISRHVAYLSNDASWKVDGLDTRSGADALQEDSIKCYQVVLPSAELGFEIQEAKPEVCIHCAGCASVDLSMSDPLSDSFFLPEIRAEKLVC